jgi:hypothetical protein
MARKVLEELRLCRTCGRKTLHQRNSKEMSWIMHLALTIFTAGLWLLVWVFLAFWHVLTKPMTGGRWTCSMCGREG